MAIYEGTSLVLKGEKWELGVTNEKFRPLFSPFKPMYFLFLALNSLPSVFSFLL